MDNAVMFDISYGLYVLTASDGKKDNGCIINTLMQVTSVPNRVSVTVNKSNYTCDLIQRLGNFNVSMLTQKTPFSVFENFGFRSGRDADKFDGFKGAQRAENNIMYLGADYANSYIEADVHTKIDLGTHIMFIADVKDGKVLSDVLSLTYSYYQENIKPKPEKKAVHGWRCKICGYVYEGDELPADFICPICKHGAEAFERI